MKYEVSNKVRIKSIDWYNENKNEDGDIPSIDKTSNTYGFIKEMQVLCGEVMTISQVNHNCYNMVEDDGEYSWTDEMIEGLADEIEITQDVKIFSEGYEQGYEDSQHDMNEWILPEGFEFHDENGNVINATKIILEKKKKEYPKTYEECYKILNMSRDYTCHNNVGYKWELITNFQKLLICRDAYWKIAGEEMGLGKPWEPDFSDDSPKYNIFRYENEITLSDNNWSNRILAFPTKEMRGAFYKNFKELIEQCKELL